jgi:hypothetical protein
VREIDGQTQQQTPMHHALCHAVQIPNELALDMHSTDTSKKPVHDCINQCIVSSRLKNLCYRLQAWTEEQAEHGRALTSRISWVRLMFSGQTSSYLTFTASAFLQTSTARVFTIPSVTPAFPILSFFLIPCSRRSSSRGSHPSCACSSSVAAQGFGLAVARERSWGLM